MKLGYTYILLLLLLLLDGCAKESFPRCVPADAFGAQKFFVAALYPEGHPDFIANTGESSDGLHYDQVTRWQNTGLLTSGGDLVLRSQGHWSAWVKGNKTKTPGGYNSFSSMAASQRVNDVEISKDRLCGPLELKDNMMSAACGGDKKCLTFSGMSEDDFISGNYGAPCWFTNGMGMYVLLRRPGDPDPNETMDIMRYPVSPMFHMGYNSVQERGMNSFLTLLHDIKDNSCVSSVGDEEGTQIGKDWQIYVKILDQYYWNNTGGYFVEFLRGTNVTAPEVLEKVRSSVQGIMYQAMRQVFNGITGNPFYQQSVKAFLVIFIAVTMLLYLSGLVSPQNMKGDMLLRIFKFWLVSMLLIPDAWEFFYNYLFSLWWDGMNALIAMMVVPLIGFDTFDINKPFTVIDYMVQKVIFAREVWEVKMRAVMIAYPWGIFSIIVIVIIIMIFLYVLFHGFLVYLLGVLALSFIISTFPILFLGMLFERFKQTFNAWITQATSFTFQSIVIFILISLFANMIVNYYYRIFGFTACYNAVMTIHLGPVKLPDLKDYSPGQIFLPWVVKPLFGWGSKEEYSSAEKALYARYGLGESRNGLVKRVAFTGGAGIIPIPPYYKEYDFRRVDTPFLDPDRSSSRELYSVHLRGRPDVFVRYSIEKARGENYQDFMNSLFLTRTAVDNVYVARAVSQANKALQHEKDKCASGDPTCIYDSDDKRWSTIESLLSNAASRASGYGPVARDMVETAISILDTIQQDNGYTDPPIVEDDDITSSLSTYGNVNGTANQAYVMKKKKNDGNLYAAHDEDISAESQVCHINSLNVSSNKAVIAGDFNNTLSDYQYQVISSASDVMGAGILSDEEFQKRKEKCGNDRTCIFSTGDLQEKAVQFQQDTAGFRQEVVNTVTSRLGDALDSVNGRRLNPQTCRRLQQVQEYIANSLAEYGEHTDDPNEIENRKRAIELAAAVLKDAANDVAFFDGDEASDEIDAFAYEFERSVGIINDYDLVNRIVRSIDANYQTNIQQNLLYSNTHGTSGNVPNNTNPPGGGGLQGRMDILDVERLNSFISDMARISYRDIRLTGGRAKEFDKKKGYDYLAIREIDLNGNIMGSIAFLELLGMLVIAFLMYNMRQFVFSLGGAIAGASPFAGNLSSAEFFTPNNPDSLSGMMNKKLGEMKGVGSIPHKVLNAKSLYKGAVGALPGGAVRKGIGSIHFKQGGSMARVFGHNVGEKILNTANTAQNVARSLGMTTRELTEEAKEYERFTKGTRVQTARAHMTAFLPSPSDLGPKNLISKGMDYMQARVAGDATGGIGQYMKESLVRDKEAINRLAHPYDDPVKTPKIDTMEDNVMNQMELDAEAQRAAAAAELAGVQNQISAAIGNAGDLHALRAHLSGMSVPPELAGKVNAALQEIDNHLADSAKGKGDEGLDFGDGKDVDQDNKEAINVNEEEVINDVNPSVDHAAEKQGMQNEFKDEGAGNVSGYGFSADPDRTINTQDATEASISQSVEDDIQNALNDEIHDNNAILEENNNMESGVLEGQRSSESGMDHDNGMESGVLEGQRSSASGMDHDNASAFVADDAGEESGVLVGNKSAKDDELSAAVSEEESGVLVGNKSAKDDELSAAVSEEESGVLAENKSTQDDAAGMGEAGEESGQLAEARSGNVGNDLETEGVLGENNIGDTDSSALSDEESAIIDASDIEDMLDEELSEVELDKENMLYATVVESDGFDDDADNMHMSRDDDSYDMMDEPMEASSSSGNAKGKIDESKDDSPAGGVLKSNEKKKKIKKKVKTKPSDKKKLSKKKTDKGVKKGRSRDNMLSPDDAKHAAMADSKSHLLELAREGNASKKEISDALDSLWQNTKLSMVATSGMQPTDSDITKNIMNKSFNGQKLDEFMQASWPDNDLGLKIFDASPLGKEGYAFGGLKSSGI